MQERTGVDDIPAMLASWENRKELADQWKHQLEEAAAQNQWENPVPAHWEENPAGSQVWIRSQKMTITCQQEDA